MDRIAEIQSPDTAAMKAAKSRWDSIAKPLGSFGVLEEMITQIAGIQGSADVNLCNRTVVVLCADHGVTEEGVTQTGSEVTAQCAWDIAEGISNVNVIAGQVGAAVMSVDIGMKSDIRHPLLLSRKIAPGTRNFTKGAAMTRAQAEEGIRIGMDIVRSLKEHHVQIVLTGEMGIGNTTPTAALSAVLLNKTPAEVTGRGAGLSSEGLQRKVRAVEAAIEINRPDPHDPLDLLSKLGGFEIAGMTGLFLGGAYYQIPVVIDGVISAVAAALACQMGPLCKAYLLPSHTSTEPAAAGLMERMGLHPVIQAGLRLGEGTGALLLLPLLDAACALYCNAHRFTEAGIPPYEVQS